MKLLFWPVTLRRWQRRVAVGATALGLVSVPAAEHGFQNPVQRMRDMDHDGDGRVSRTEFRGPERIFERMDTNQDGFVTPAEATAMRDRNRGRPSGARPGGDGPGVRPRGGGGLSPLRVDRNHDDLVSRAEWDEFFQDADTNGDELLDRREWEGAVKGRRPNDPAPAVGASAPKVRAQHQNNAGWVDLAAPNRFTVLVFGSHT